MGPDNNRYGMFYGVTFLFDIFLILYLTTINRSQLQGHKASRDLHELIALKHLWSHPTRGETTYELDDKG